MFVFKAEIMKVSTFITFLLLLTSLSLMAQDKQTIEVELTIQQKVKDQITTFPHAEVMISDIGKVKTNELGEFFFNYPVGGEGEDPVVAIEVLSEAHQLLQPVDGAVSINASENKVKLDFLVVDMSKEDEEFQKRIQNLESRVKRLQRDNSLTVRQVNSLNKTLLDTILHFEANRIELENQVQSYAQLSESQTDEIRALNSQISRLEEQVDQLTMELEGALEERYLRQNEYFKNISQGFLSYLRKAKDLRDHLPYISTYYNSPSGFDNYGQDIVKYNEVWENLDDNRFNYLEGVEKYWNNPTLTSELEKLYEFLLKGIHQSQVLRTVNDINAELHKQKPKKAQKIASNSHENLAVNIRTLERQINRLLTQMRRIT